MQAKHSGRQRGLVETLVQRLRAAKTQTNSSRNDRPSILAARCNVESVTFPSFDRASGLIWLRLVFILFGEAFGKCVGLHRLSDLPCQDFLDRCRLKLLKFALILQEAVKRAETGR